MSSSTKNVAFGCSQGDSRRNCLPCFVSSATHSIWCSSSMGCGASPMLTMTEAPETVTEGTCFSCEASTLFGCSAVIGSPQHMMGTPMSFTIVTIFPQCLHMRNFKSFSSFCLIIVSISSAAGFMPGFFAFEKIIRVLWNFSQTPPSNQV